MKLAIQENSQKYISESYEIDKSVVSRLITGYKAKETVETALRPVRLGKTSPKMDRIIKWYSTKDAFASGMEIKGKLSLEISSQTIQHGLREGGLFSCRPAKKPYINSEGITSFCDDLFEVGCLNIKNSVV